MIAKYDCHAVRTFARIIHNAFELSAADSLLVGATWGMLFDQAQNLFGYCVIWALPARCSSRCIRAFWEEEAEARLVSRES